MHLSAFCKKTEDKSAANELFGAADMVSLKTGVSETVYPSIAPMALCGCFAQTSRLSLLTVSPQKILDCGHVGCFPFDFKYLPFPALFILGGARRLLYMYNSRMGPNNSC